MNRELLIERTGDWIRAALLEDGQLCEVHQERENEKKQTESLFLGRVQSIRPAVCAAFVDIGEERNAFLPLRPDSALRCGDLVLVQGAAVQAVETKGLRVSEAINLAGKWLVLAPGGQGVHLSRKIREPALREALSEAVSPLCPQGCGLIVRTASAEVTQEALAQEAKTLYERWQQIARKAKGMTKPGLVHEPPGLCVRFVRDIGSTLSRVTTNDAACAAQLAAAREEGWLCAEAEIVRFDETAALMTDVFSLDAQVDKALSRRVWLPCGGYLVIECCEAMTVIDVNSGKMVLGRDTEDTALRVNLEAAQEIGRQLRLRDIGGIVIVDYIDMALPEHRESLLRVIREVCARDRSSVRVMGLTRLGLVEMTRRRSGETLGRVMQGTCRACDGTGRQLSVQETALRALRQLRRMELSGQRGPFLIRCAPGTAAELAAMHLPAGEAEVYVLGAPGHGAGRFAIEQLDIAALPPQGAKLLQKRVEA